MKRALFALLPAMFLAALPARAMEILHPDGVYVQQASGMTYPVAVDEFSRKDIIRYKPDGTDESAGYNRMTPGAEISMTVYVFPSPSLTSIGSSREVILDAREHLCLDQFHGVEGEVTSAHPDAQLLGEEDVTLDQPGLHATGRKASYAMNIQSWFGRAQKTRSEAYLFCFAGGQWSVEYRVDYPIDHDGGGAVSAFMRDLVWTIPPEN